MNENEMTCDSELKEHVTSDEILKGAMCKDPNAKALHRFAKELGQILGRHLAKMDLPKAAGVGIVTEK